VALTTTVRSLLARPLPAPPERLRQGPFREDGGEEPPHDARTAALLGRALGIAFGVCFVTGLVSHLHQHPVTWLDLPSRPVWGYQLTQGVHVATGIASVPLLLAKLWTVYRRLFAWPPARDVGRALERLLLVPLVAGAVFELLTGLLNIVQWYPFHFAFPVAHYTVAWIVVAAMLVHLGLKAPLARSVTGRRRLLPAAPPGAAPSAERRALLVGTTAAVGAVTLATVGQTVSPLRAVSVLASRDPAVGPQGLPVNRSAAAARVAAAATDPRWRLVVAGPRPVELTLAQLGALPQFEADLPIACVEGWSATARWGGVRLRDVLDLAGVPPGRHLILVSLEQGGYQTAPVGPSEAADPLSLLALRVGGEPLALDHGYPLRFIGPNRPGVQQTKWLSRIELA
jgi:DMSO/TMAO reductase YedYZ molybdopterin-dependent catalytic subunit